MCLEPCKSGVVLEDDKCTPGTKWNEKCNKCSCNKNGIPLCTKKMCVDESTEKPETVVEKRLQKTKDDVEKCEPGKKWNEDCNKCSCNQNGIPLCTKKLCVTDIKRKLKTVSDRESAAPTKKEEKPNPYFSHELQNYNRRFDNHIPFASPRYPKNILVSGQNNWYGRSNPGNMYSLSDCSQLALKGFWCSPLEKTPTNCHVCKCYHWRSGDSSIYVGCPNKVIDRPWSFM
ncbi:unnamed protein product [Tenebrio molitor]|nr:unnamed protein product [Tenebrio molitor]